MHAETGLQLAAPAHGVQRPLGCFFAVAASIVAVLAIFWPTSASMVEIWRRSETFQHCFAVVPIVLWLIWNDRHRLAATPARPWWPGLGAIAMLGLGWLLGVLGAAQVVSHFALVGMVAAVVVTAFGLAWGRVLWFPLLFLLFAVPFGEALVPRLMDWTADFTVAALRVSGVPVYREGVHFVIPTGQWSVIEACSGIKFLIASVMAGSLYAWLMYRSPIRRLAFLAASIVVPLLANWLRAYLIVMIGHLSRNRLMTNDDHIVFGWVLFAAVMLLMYWWGARWREDGGASEPDAPGVAAAPRARALTVGVAALAAAAAWPVLARVLLQPLGPATPVEIVAPEPTNGWQREATPLSSWSPDLEGASSERTFVYRKGTQRVALVVAGYRDQSQTAQVGSSANQLVRTTNEQWQQTARGSAALAGGPSAAAPGAVHAAELRAARAADRLVVWQWYWSGGQATSSAAQTKVDLARARLLRHPDTALWIAAYVVENDERSSANDRLRDFLRDMGPSLQRAFGTTTAR
jgi:exosortase A